MKPGLKTFAFIFAVITVFSLASCYSAYPRHRVVVYDRPVYTRPVPVYTPPVYAPPVYNNNRYDRDDAYNRRYRRHHRRQDRDDYRSRY